MTIQKILITAAAIGLVASSASAPAGARSLANEPTPVTFSRDVAVPGMTLPAGRYVFERANPLTSADVILIRGDHGRVQWLGMTRPVDRRDRGTTVVQLSEAARGEAPRVLAWFPSDSTRGAEFIY